MKQINFMPENIRDLVARLETIQRSTTQFPELQAQAAKLISLLKNMSRWMVCTNVSKHATIITCIVTLACIVLEKYGLPRIEQYSIPAAMAMQSGMCYSLGKVKNTLVNLNQETDKFHIICRNIFNILEHTSRQDKQKG